jgi:CBS domain-containing protein
MNIGSFCSSDLITTEATDTLQEAAEKMSRSHVGALAVVESGELVGVISEADLMTAIAEQANLFDTAVEEYMTEDPVSVDPEEDPVVAARRMVENGIGYLFVVRNGLPVGVVSRGDLLASGAAVGAPAR